MTDFNPFNAAPDPALGRVLREELTAADPAGFVARVRAAILRDQPDSAWDVLARWTRPGIVAAAGVALVAGLWLGFGLEAPTDAASIADTVQSAGVPAPLLGALPGPDAVLAAAVEGR